MTATYLIRLDDLCPTMDLETWEPLEAAMIASDIRPIAAVVPENADPHLDVAPADPRFWDRVRRWQSLGWTIAIHGQRHRYVTRHPGIVGINPMSEFAGVPIEEQRRKLERGIAVFRSEGVEPTVWVAPGHSFDRSTLIALRGLGITTISDGFFLGPRRDDLGMLWIPQQLWRLRSVPIGVWTVCFHPNALSPDALNATLDGLSAFRDRISGVADLPPAARTLGAGDHMMASAMRHAIASKRWIKARRTRERRTAIAQDVR